MGCKEGGGKRCNERGGDEGAMLYQKPGKYYSVIDYYVSLHPRVRSKICTKMVLYIEAYENYEIIYNIHTLKHHHKFSKNEI